MAKGPVPSPIIDDSDLAAIPERLAADRRRLRRSILGSGLFHGLLLLLLIGLWPRSEPKESPPITVRLVPGVGAAGAAGGSGGGALAEGPVQDGSAVPTPETGTPETTESTAVRPATESVAPAPEPENAPAAEATPPPEPPPVETASTQPPPVQQLPEVTVVAPPEPTVQPETPASTEAQSAPPEKMPPLPPHKPRPPKPATRLAAAPLPPAAAPQPTPPAQTARAPVTAQTPGTPGAEGGSGGAGGSGQGMAGAGEGAVGAGKGPGDDYLDRVRRHIKRYLIYPEVARQQKREGDATMAVVLRRDGTVLSAKIEQSTGYPELDSAMLKAVHDASPVPPFPKSYEREQGEVLLPFDFHLGLIDRLFR